jgi:hypothetical protein
MPYTRRALVLVCLLAGCGSSDGGGTPPVSPGVDAASAAAVDSAAPAAVDGATVTPGDGSVAAPIDGPVGPAKARRLVSGRARLVGDFEHSCSTPVGNGDRWCAFSLPSETLGQTALWVINVSKALAGTVTCDGKDPGCLRLTDTLWAGIEGDGSFGYPFAHQFTGETLIFLGDAPLIGGTYQGPHYAWRPGWPAAKMLSAKAITCLAHPLTDAVYCQENAQSGMGYSPTVDLHAGRAGTSPLPLVATIYRRTATGAIQWGAAISPLGDHFAWSSGGVNATDPETLYVAKIDEAATPEKRIVVGTGLSQWDLSGDGKRWYFERNYNYPPFQSAVEPTGTLVTADFPMGGNEKTIATGVEIYSVFDQPGTARGVGWFDNVTAGGGTFKILRDPANPAGAQTVSAGVQGFIVSPDLRYTLLETASASIGSQSVHDGIVVNNATMARCTLAMMPTISTGFGPTFLPTGGLVFWGENINAQTLSAEGWMANPEGCTGRTKFSDKADFWLLAREQGLLVGEPTADPAKWNVRATKLAPGGTLGAASTVATNVDIPFGVPFDRDYVVYGTFTGGADDGLYVYGPIGFGAP